MDAALVARASTRRKTLMSAKKKFAKRSHFSALALPKTRFDAKKRTQTNPKQSH